ncbi:MAG: hypothetical protein JWP29_5644 [Rhodoferax sp.]|nr:hypothetical protein [Rhodoferax sp.]
MEAETGRAKARERKYEKGYAKKVMQDLLEVEPGDDVPQPNAKEMEGWVLSQEILRKVGVFLVTYVFLLLLELTLARLLLSLRRMLLLSGNMSGTRGCGGASKLSCSKSCSTSCRCQFRTKTKAELRRSRLIFMPLNIVYIAIGAVAKIVLQNRVQNDSRVVTQVQKMISTDPVDLVARRISGWVKEVRAKDGGPDALQSCGIFYCDNNNRRSVECELKMMLAIKERVLSCPEGLTKLKEAGL